MTRATTRAASFALAAMASLAAVCTATPAFAQDERSMTVRYGDLDLSSDRGVERLNTRVRMAANKVCDVRLARDLNAVRQAYACRDTALDRATRDVDFAVARARSDQQLAGRADSTLAVSTR